MTINSIAVSDQSGARDPEKQQKNGERAPNRVVFPNSDNLLTISKKFYNSHIQIYTPYLSSRVYNLVGAVES